MARGLTYDNTMNEPHLNTRFGEGHYIQQRQFHDSQTLIIQVKNEQPYVTPLRPQKWLNVQNSQSIEHENTYSKLKPNKPNQKQLNISSHKSVHSTKHTVFDMEPLFCNSNMI